MGEVYRARDAKLNRDVAIKVLPAALSTDFDYMARFQREAQVLASLNHLSFAKNGSVRLQCAHSDDEGRQAPGSR